MMFNFFFLLDSGIQIDIYCHKVLCGNVNSIWDLFLIDQFWVLFFIKKCFRVTFDREVSNGIVTE